MAIGMMHGCEVVTPSGQIAVGLKVKPKSVKAIDTSFTDPPLLAALTVALPLGVQEAPEQSDKVAESTGPAPA
jgi:hypothetical protein